MVTGTIRTAGDGTEPCHYRLTRLGRGVLDHRRGLLLGFDRAVHALLPAEDVGEKR